MPFVTEEGPSREAVIERAERRERIATAVMPDIYAKYYEWAELPERGWREDWKQGVAQAACDLADALLAELDRRRDAELAEALP